jgi:hypothetical protein
MTLDFDTLAHQASQLYQAEKTATDIVCTGGIDTPELLYTETFARLVYQYRCRDNPVAVRLGELLARRQDLLLDRASPARAVFVISESAVRHLAACHREPDAAGGQLEHMLDLSSRSRLSLRIQSFTAPQPPPSAPHAVVTDADGRRTGFIGDLLPPVRLQTHHRHNTVDKIADGLDQLTSECLDENTSRAVLQRALAHCRSACGGPAAGCDHCPPGL